MTLPGFEGRGVATSMAAALLALARDAAPQSTIAAQARPERNPSTRVLETLGFLLVGTVHHREDGMVWEWQLPPTEGR